MRTKTARKKIVVLLFTVVMSCIVCAVEAQVTYGYDESGNRTGKTVTLKKSLSKKANLSEIENPSDNDFVSEEFENPMHDVVGNAQIIIYPNPTHGELRVEISGVELVPSDNITIFDSNGRIIRQNYNVTGSNDIDLSEAAAGLYIMRICIEGKFTTWRIIKE